MNEGDAFGPAFRAGGASDTEACIAIWVEACTARDGRAYNGVAERARPKFGESITWLVADTGRETVGFVVATPRGSGLPTDPPDAAVVGLLAVSPRRQTRGLGRALLRAATNQLADLGYAQAVLHALVDNAPAVRLYESQGWVAVGAEYEHSLLKRPVRTFAHSLHVE